MTPWVKGKVKIRDTAFNLWTARLGQEEQTDSSASAPDQRLSCPLSHPLARHPNLLQLFQMVAVSQTKCQMGEALCAHLAEGQPVGNQRVAGQEEPQEV